MRDGKGLLAQTGRKKNIEKEEGKIVGMKIALDLDLKKRPNDHSTSSINYSPHGDPNQETTTKTQ